MNDGVAQASPEFFSVAVKRGAAGDESPEFPSELTMDAAEDPPAMQEVFAFRSAKLLPELFATALVFEIAFDLLFEGLQHARHRDQHRDTFATDRADYVSRFECVLEDHGAAHQLRQEDARNCPKTWLSGNRFKKRTGCTHRSYFRYFRISSSSGAILARTLPCVITTPLGSAVVPEVKTISSVSAGSTSAAG